MWFLGAFLLLFYVIFLYFWGVFYQTIIPLALVEVWDDCSQLIFNARLWGRYGGGKDQWRSLVTWPFLRPQWCDFVYFHLAGGKLNFFVCLGPIIPTLGRGQLNSWHFSFSCTGQQRRGGSSWSTWQSRSTCELRYFIIWNNVCVCVRVWLI